MVVLAIVTELVEFKILKGMRKESSSTDSTVGSHGRQL